MTAKGDPKGGKTGREKTRRQAPLPNERHIVEVTHRESNKPENGGKVKLSRETKNRKPERKENHIGVKVIIRTSIKTLSTIKGPWAQPFLKDVK